MCGLFTHLDLNYKSNSTYRVFPVLSVVGVGSKRSRHFAEWEENRADNDNSQCTALQVLDLPVGVALSPETVSDETLNGMDRVGLVWRVDSNGVPVLTI